MSIEIAFTEILERSRMFCSNKKRGRGRNYAMMSWQRQRARFHPTEMNFFSTWF